MAELEAAGQNSMFGDAPAEAAPVETPAEPAQVEEAPVAAVEATEATPSAE